MVLFFFSPIFLVLLYVLFSFWKTQRGNRHSAQPHFYLECSCFTAAAEATPVEALVFIKYRHLPHSAPILIFLFYGYSKHIVQVNAAGALHIAQLHQSHSDVLLYLLCVHVQCHVCIVYCNEWKRWKTKEPFKRAHLFSH